MHYKMHINSNQSYSSSSSHSTSTSIWTNTDDIMGHICNVFLSLSDFTKNTYQRQEL